VNAHTCHTSYCWMLSCAVCASCEACAEAYNARRPTLPDAVELLRETPTDDPEHTAWLDAAETKLAARMLRTKGVV